jgi:hypothetical protein
MQKFIYTTLARFVLVVFPRALYNGPPRADARRQLHQAADRPTPCLKVLARGGRRFAARLASDRAATKLNSINHFCSLPSPKSGTTNRAHYILEFRGLRGTSLGQPHPNREGPSSVGNAVCLVDDIRLEVTQIPSGNLMRYELTSALEVQIATGDC